VTESSARASYEPGDDGYMVDDVVGDEVDEGPPPPLPEPRPADVEGIILGLAAQEASGCLTITGPGGDEGLVWFRDGQVYAVSVPGRRPLLGVRLVTAGAISPDQLNSALEMQRTEMSGSRLGEVLVRLRLVNRRVIENFALEQQRDMLAELLGWPVESHWFRNGAKTRTDLAPFLDVTELLKQAHIRQQQWPLVVDEIGGVDVVPLPTGAAPHAELTASEHVVLGLVDGVRNLVDIADDCGFTVYEAADVLLGLAAAGLVTTATDLLHEPWAPEPVITVDTAELAEVLPLHPGDLGTVVADDEADQYGDESPIRVVDEPWQPPADPGALSFEPAVTPEPTPYSLLPPPSAGPISWSAPDDGAEAEVAPRRPVGPADSTDTAALLRELSGLNQPEQ